MNESELERIAARLGDRAAARLDVDRTAEAVVARLRTPRAVHWWGSPALLRLAAAIALTIGGGMFAYRTTSRSVELAAPVLLQALSSRELEEVLDSLSFDTRPPENAAVGLPDLNDEQLRDLLRRMEG